MREKTRFIEERLQGQMSEGKHRSKLYNSVCMM